MRFPKALSAGLLALVLGEAAAASTFQSSASVPPSLLNWKNLLTFDKFDPAKGELTSVNIRIESRSVGDVGFENRDAGPATITVMAETVVEVLDPTSSTVLNSTMNTIQVGASVAANDGVLDFAGPSGRMFNDEEASSDVDVTITEPSILALFVGPGTISLPTNARGNSRSLGAANVVVSVMSEAEATVTIRYNFNPNEDEREDVDCEEFDRYDGLTPNDTLTVSTRDHNPNHDQGYAYAYAVDRNGRAVGFDHLIGDLLVVNGLESFQYSINAVDYRAKVGEGELTDVDMDGIRDLDGLEYEMTAGELLVPRFIGQSARSESQIILIDLAGGSKFTTTVDFKVYNDDEDQFSAQFTFFCWEKTDIRNVSMLFENEWLKNFSGDNKHKGLGGAEYGWFRLRGGISHSNFFDIQHPAVYGVYIEVTGHTAAADLPFEICQAPGHLLPRSISGDNSNRDPNAPRKNCDGNIRRNRKASLLLYPEFDNRDGVRTVLTATNTSTEEDARLHFIYVGRYR